MKRTRRILIANGPNLGRIGQRDPHIYGTRSIRDLPEIIACELGPAKESVELEYFQSNSQGALIDRLESAWEAKTHGLVLNAGALTHTSLALADCLAWIRIPCVEVHISNVQARTNPLRQVSMIGRHCLATISGFGLESYVLAVRGLITYLDSKDTAQEQGDTAR